MIAAPRPLPSAVRRPGPARRRRAIGRAIGVTFALVAVLAGNVWLTTVAADRGVRLRVLREEVRRLEEDRARLEAELAALSAPERIERLARTQLGLRPPLARQLLVLPVPSPARPDRVARTDEPLWVRVLGWLGEGIARAQERR